MARHLDQVAGSTQPMRGGDTSRPRRAAIDELLRLLATRGYLTQADLDRAFEDRRPGRRDEPDLIRETFATNERAMK